MKIQAEMNQRFFIKPFGEVVGILEKDTVGREGITCCDSIKMRLYHLVQVISSLVAIPLNILAGLFEAAVNLCTGEDWKGSFVVLGKHLRFHAMVLFPTSLVGIFGPASWTPTIVNNLTDVAFCAKNANP